jgi:hypothetical protein
MRNAYTWTSMPFLVLNAFIAAGQEAHGASTAEKAVLALENRWLQSEKTNNPDWAAPLMADRYVNTWIDGSALDKTQTLAGAKARRYSSVSDADVKVRVYGDAAIVTGVCAGKGADAGKPFEERGALDGHLGKDA